MIFLAGTGWVEHDWSEIDSKAFWQINTGIQNMYGKHWIFETIYLNWHLPLLFCKFSFCLESGAIFFANGHHPSYCMLHFLLPRFAVWQRQIIFGNMAGHSPGQFLKVTKTCLNVLCFSYSYTDLSLLVEYIWQFMMVAILCLNVFSMLHGRHGFKADLNLVHTCVFLDR